MENILKRETFADGVSVKMLVTAGLFAALGCAATMVLQIPSPTGGEAYRYMEKILNTAAVKILCENPVAPKRRQLQNITGSGTGGVHRRSAGGPASAAWTRTRQKHRWNAGPP